MTERKSLPLFAALDLNTLREARQTMDMLSGVVDAIKIGPRLYAQGGAHFLKEIVDHGFKLFLDLKLHDIPNTVKKAMRVLAGLDADIVNLHAAGTRAMMEAALEGLTRPDGSRPYLPRGFSGCSLRLRSGIR